MKNVVLAVRSALVVEETDEYVTLGAALGGRRRALRFLVRRWIGERVFPYRYYSIDFSESPGDGDLYCFPIVRWRQHELWRGKRQLLIGGK